MIALGEMPFLNPGFVWAACALALVPLLITILNRRRHREVPWAAMRFLLAASRKSVHRTRIEQLLLLLLRTCLLILLALALARPWLQAAQPPGLLAGGTRHILVLDDSYSMFAAGPPAPDPAFEVQRRLALGVLQAIPSGDPIHVVTSGAPAAVLNQSPMVVKAVARQLLQGITPRQTGGDLAGALQAAHGLLEVADGPARSVVHVFSDFAQAVLVQAGAVRRGAAAVAESARLVLHDVTDGGTANLSNAALEVGDPLVAVDQPTSLNNRIANHAALRSAAGQLRVWIDGRPARELELPPLEPGETRTVSIPVDFNTAGLHTVETKVVAAPDALALDDTRRVVIAVREQVPVMVVDGKPDVALLNGQAGYLATALSPGFQTGRMNFLAPAVVSDNELHTDRLNATAIVVLCNVRRLEPAQWEQLTAVVQAGGGVLIYLGDLVDLDHYNEWGGDLLPAWLDQQALPNDGDDPVVRFDPTRLGGSLQTEFAGRPRSGLFRAQVRKYIRLTAALEYTRPLLYYDNGDLAAAARQVGHGRCILFGTTANMDWTNLPAKGDFVALVMALVHDVAPANAADHNHRVGGRWTPGTGAPPIPADVHIVAPDGEVRRVSLTAGADGRQAPDGLDQAGWYTVQTPAGDQPLAVNLDPAEGDLTPLTHDDLRRALACDFEYVTAHAEGGPPRVRSELTRLMVYAVVGLLLVETFLAMKFGHQRH